MKEWFNKLAGYLFPKRRFQLMVEQMNRDFDNAIMEIMKDPKFNTIEASK
tara:strand:+ start:417 stop:566 length:150 start_codon:yes stop_codon:yes gene_type:complete